LRLEELFSCLGRLKIIMALLEHGELNISKLARLSGLNYVAADKHVRELSRLGVVVERRLGRARMVSLDDRRPEVRLLGDFIREWRSLFGETTA